MAWRWVRVRVWRWLTAAVVWLLAVAVVSAVAWFAIASAGREVAGADHAMTLVSAVQPSPAVATTLATAGPAPSPSATTLGAPPPDSGTKAGTPSATPSVPGPGGGWAGSYSSAGGVVIVRCVGGKAAASAARAADGWRVEATARPGGSLRVLFVSADGRTVGVDAVCKNGPPSFVPVR